ncbi:alkaline phosphatase family protein [Streptomyces sp. NPDC096198]|uniref:alkaline phosphatase family protein n=1 Tax=Streptomyces sp. NPDC096198 TaxID=3366080 RepID=UPI0038257890
MSGSSAYRRRRRARRARTAVASAAALAATAFGLWAGLGGEAPAHAASAVPRPDHVVVVVFENHAYSQVIGSSGAPYINSLRSGGASLTQSYAETHPSQPNYFALFSGSTQGVTDDSCYTPGFSSAPNLAAEQLAASRTWASYNETLPGPGSTTCTSGSYARKHNPWFGFANVPTSSAKTFAQFPADYATLPQLSFVVPNLCSDMHDCSVSTGDTWLKNNLGAYATWARTHNSLLVLTFDEDNKLSGNRIPTVLYGQPVAAGSTSSTTYNHYDLLRTLEDTQGLTAHAGNATAAKDITGVWAS